MREHNHRYGLNLNVGLRLQGELARDTAANLAAFITAAAVNPDAGRSISADVLGHFYGLDSNRYRHLLRITRNPTWVHLQLTDEATSLADIDITSRYPLQNGTTLKQFEVAHEATASFSEIDLYQKYERLSHLIHGDAYLRVYQDPSNSQPCFNLTIDTPPQQ